MVADCCWLMIFSFAVEKECMAHLNQEDFSQRRFPKRAFVKSDADWQAKHLWMEVQAELESVG